MIEPVGRNNRRALRRGGTVIRRITPLANAPYEDIRGNKNAGIFVYR